MNTYKRSLNMGKSFQYKNDRLVYKNGSSLCTWGSLQRKTSGRV